MVSNGSSTVPLPVLVLVGPTASGKTDLLLELSSEVRSSGIPPLEVISADSMQAYRGMDIGTAKPGPEELSRLPHRLIDIRDPDEQYTVGDFVHLADEACELLSAAGRLPVVAGGTGFYVRNFIFGLPSSPAASPALREAVARDLEALGPEALRAELEAGDPESAARIHANDVYRLTRAVEILRATGRPMADFAPSSSPRGRYRFLPVELSRPREELSRRIDARVDAMFARGLAAEVVALAERGYGPEAPGMKAIGYREFFAKGIRGTDSLRGAGYAGGVSGDRAVGLEGGQPDAPVGDQGAGDAESCLRDLSPAGLAAISEEIKLDTRQYAKRQETFFRGLPGLVRLEVEGGGGTAGAAARLGELLSAFLA
jgi:tRNA dimethylallyltransferase